MKRICSIFVLLFASTIVLAQDFNVNSLAVDIYLSKEGYFDVVENYDIEFQEPKHGIYRYIITHYDHQDEGGKTSKREIYISNIDVPGHTFESTSAFAQKFNKNIRIKIGDKDTYVNGRQSYEIRYRVKNALIFEGDVVQLYWNLKPPDWFAIFFKVSFVIHGVEGAEMSPANSFVYSGPLGVSTPSTEFNYLFSDSTFSASSKEGFLSTYGQSVTVLVKLPRTVIEEVDYTPSFYERYRWVGIIGFIFLGIILIIRKILEGDKAVAVTSYYPPEGIDPALAGVLIDNKADFRDITSLLPYWATKGFIRMEEIPKGDRSLRGDLKLTKIHDLPVDTPAYAYNLFYKIFAYRQNEILSSTLRGVMAEPRRLLSKKSEEYYSNSRANKWLRWSILLLSWLWAFSSITFVPFLLRNYIDIESTKFILLIVANFLFFFLVFPVVFAIITIKVKGKNTKGKALMPELWGFHQFIKTAEVERIKALLIKDPTYFEKTMPYAVAFNLLKEWTARFDSLNMQVPSWYTSSTGSHFKWNTFSSSFGNSMVLFRNAGVSVSSTGSSSSSRSSSSSGGGSSGGGFGGGGGGSW